MSCYPTITSLNTGKTNNNMSGFDVTDRKSSTSVDCSIPKVYITETERILLVRKSPGL